jgi:hypothetical protein
MSRNDGNAPRTPPGEPPTAWPAHLPRCAGGQLAGAGPGIRGGGGNAVAVRKRRRAGCTAAHGAVGGWLFPAGLCRPAAWEGHQPACDDMHIVNKISGV